VSQLRLLFTSESELVFSNFIALRRCYSGAWYGPIAGIPGQHLSANRSIRSHINENRIFNQEATQCKWHQIVSISFLSTI